jgi:hypothetical protein
MGQDGELRALFQSLWGRIGPAAIEARDQGSEAKADVMLVATLAMARAMVIMVQGDRAAVQHILKTAHAALDASVDEAVDLMAIANERFDGAQR